MMEKADMLQKRPDIILLGAAWPERALLRAQLIEEGLDVVAVDAWPIPRLYRRPEMKPRLLVVDLHELPEPRAVLDELRVVLPPQRVLVIAALGTLEPQEIARFGYRVIERPVSVLDIVRVVREMMQRAGKDAATADSAGSST
jgi:hypothetical protein